MIGEAAEVGLGSDQHEPCVPSCDAGETLQGSDPIRLAFRKPVSVWWME